MNSAKYKTKVRYLFKNDYYLHNNNIFDIKTSFTSFIHKNMLASQDRQRSKSARRIKIKSPLNLGHKISLEEQSQEKNKLKKSKGSNTNSIDSERNAFVKYG